jgi:Rhodopirellula transposase DDE domain
VRCELDSNVYAKGIVVSDQDMARLNITRDEFHGEWNYTLHPAPIPDNAVIFG